MSEMKLTDLEKRRLKKLQEQANEFHERHEALKVEMHRITKLQNKVYTDFEKFWAPIRKREMNR